MDSKPSSSSGRYENSNKKPYLSKSVSDANTHNQSLASILNNPHAGKSDGWWWPSNSSSLPVVPEFTPLNPLPKPGSDITRTDFLPYITSFSDPFTRFHDIQKHSKFSLLDDQNGENALVACLREVPALYFKEDFQLKDGATFKAACPFRTTAENSVMQEKLSQYLDVVELHLVREISLRSRSFFEAQGKLEDLNSKIVEGCKRIRELKETIRLLDNNLVGPARKLEELNVKRNDLVALQNKLNLLIYVNQALSTLNLLVASADCAGALDVTDDLQHLLDGDELAGLHCFRHLRDDLAASIDSINSILSAEFLRITIQETGNMDAAITSKFKARATVAINGEGHEVKLDEEETSNFRDRLLPFVIGLLRTAKLPAVLRIYRDTLTADMKTAIKTAVEELLRVLVAQPSDSDFVAGERVVDTDGGSSSLASRLRSLAPESFVQLLKAIFMIVQAHLVQASEVKKTIEWIICHLDDHYAADSVAAAIALGAAAAETASEGDGQTFSQFSPSSNFSRVFSIQEKRNDATTMSNLSRNFRADILRENTEAVFAACDAAHGRWAKILGVRAPIHSKLRLQEFLNIYNITQEFITATEKIGGRLGYSIRGTIQSQAKAFIDFQHESRMAKLKAILDQENWAEIDFPDEFQTIVTSLFSSKSGTSGHADDDSADTATSKTEVVRKSSDPSMVDAGVPNLSHNTEQTDATSTHPDNTAQSNDTKSRERGRSSPRMLSFGGVAYHMVNCGLILVKMLSEYIDINNSLTGLSSEIVHRVVDMLKFFNTRTCQLVLGAGAMQVSGLKSITSKHLALTSQVIGFTYTIIPEIKRILFLRVPETHKGLLMLEVDRVAQEVGLLQRVLCRTLHEVDVQAIFRQVVIIFHSQISEAFSRLDISSQHARQRVYRDVQHLLGCIRSLPSDSKSNPPNWGHLDEFLEQNFGAEACQ
ncbi:vacuolar protein sorting-associated protein 54, chloroplastic-like isoform X4 [Solanum dulcamara]|uniref:vacuolar protein sorting-associated protein 54, chloroplastic-like isoform X4 n=1 Tax=Solanum dulcamara TaxID=45834 RepID=UPI002484F497|nr:vacuolar protein sorting-associated protein 54, chloroplastic-like isoform X4 [Solanum dulcamara]